ncbi:MAG: uridine kinase [Halobaculum sp.]
MSGEPFVVGIAGGTGAGKTTVAELIAESVGESVTRVPMDDYYEDLSHLAVEERAEVNYDHPDAFEWELLRDHLGALVAGEAVETPVYDFEIHNRRDETRTVEPTPVVVLEGIFALYDDAITDLLDLRLYVETDPDLRILRRIERDVVERGRDLTEVIDRYRSTVKPMHEQFVEPTKKEADLIIPEGANSVAINLLGEKLRAEVDGEARDTWDRATLQREIAARRAAPDSE